MRERALRLTTPDFSDAMERRGVVRGLRRVAGEGVLAGFARTARAVPGDADSVHASVLAAEPGEVVVVDFGGPELDVAGIGDLVAAEGKRRGLGGVVLWGPARDGRGLCEVGLPIHATGLTPAAGYHERLGELQVEIEIGGVTVRPGDLVVGDENGVVVVPRAEAEAVLARAEEIRAKDERLRAQVEAGTPLDEIPEIQAYLVAVTKRA